MLVENQDLMVLGGSGGEPFTKCVIDLVRAECRFHRIAPHEVDWDYRITCPDGGCDIYIRKGHSDPNPRFIPKAPSIWSLKAGAEGTKPPSLRKEISDHKVVREHLSNGHVYVWCSLQPMSQPRRANMRQERDALAEDLGFKPDQIEFRWIDALTEVLKAHPNVVLHHLPGLAHRLQGVMTLEQWDRESPDRVGLSVPWVEFGGREQVIQSVREHLLGKDAPGVFHIAGLSGVGKTRTVLEACRADPSLQDTLYVPSYEDLHNDTLRYLEDAKAGSCARLIMDQVPLNDYQRLSDRLEDAAGRIRVVTIGPAKRGERSRASIVVLAEPSSEDALRVLSGTTQGLDQDVLKSIAVNSGHDLRLAILLARATRADPASRGMPVRNHEDVWHRVVLLFKRELGGTVAEFEQAYPFLTVAIDLGRTDKHRRELEYVADYFQRQEAELDGAIDKAGKCGLGLKTPSFFEAGPRALAVWVFEDRLWGMLEPRVAKFLEEMPTERLRRRFVERCQEIQGPAREEVSDRIGGFFLGALGTPDLLRLNDREASRVFQAWAELDPNRGLGWLRRAVDEATNEQLISFEGVSAIFAECRGRRQIVWLCEHLACFKDHFWTCEHILFGLALHETEQIANNSTETWKQMFWPVLSFTEVPFWPRWEHLIGRLRKATQRELPLVLDAALSAITPHYSRVSPPSVVGGRVIPDEWRPATTRELGDLRAKAAKSLLEAIADLPRGPGRAATEKVLEHLGRFIYLGLVPELKRMMKPHLAEASLVRALRATLDDILAREEMLEQKRPPRKRHQRLAQDVRAWLAELDPTTLIGRIQDLTSRPYWMVRRPGARGGDPSEEAPAAYQELASAILAQPGVLVQLRDWFSSEECKSGDEVGFFLGKSDAGETLKPMMMEWFADQHAPGFLIQYMAGVRVRVGHLPQDISKALDDAVQTRPAFCLTATLVVDASEAGFRRLMDCLGRVTPDQRGKLRHLRWDPWGGVLDLPKRCELLDRFLSLAKSADAHALASVFDLLAGWCDQGKTPLEGALGDRAMAAMELSLLPEHVVDDYEWKVVAVSLMHRSPEKVAQILVTSIVDVETHRFQRSEYAQDLFRELASEHPQLAMAAIGTQVMDRRLGPVFRIFDFKGVFDAIGVETVRPWVIENGTDAAIRIARHLDGPTVGPDGAGVIPPLADWLLSEYAEEPDVFREFCMGRHSGVVRCGLARDHREDIESLVAPFRDSSKPWVREWAKYELAEIESEIKHEDHWEDERERT